MSATARSRSRSRAGSLWVANSLDATVSRIDPATLTVARHDPGRQRPDGAGRRRGPCGSRTSTPAPSRGSSRGATGSPEAARSAAPRPRSPRAAARLWVGVAANSGSHRGGTLVIVTPRPSRHNEQRDLLGRPGILQRRRSPAVHGTGLRHAASRSSRPPAPDGLRLVPDLALRSRHRATAARHTHSAFVPESATPTASRCAPDDFRRAIERLFAINSPWTRRSRTSSARGMRPHPGSTLPGIVTDNATGTVTSTSPRQTPSSSIELAESLRRRRSRPAHPTTKPGHTRCLAPGLTRSSAISPTKVRFVRNPFFREWSHAAQPTATPTRSSGEPCRPPTTP